MRGFAARSTVDEAIDWVDEHALPLGSTNVPIGDAHGRVLAEDVVSTLNVPAFDRSAMDGYAVRAEETSGAGMYNPLSFRVIGQSLPGQASDAVVKTGAAVRIMTGAPMPAGADAVVPVEVTREADGQVEITEATAVGKHVGRVGEDIAVGTTVLPAGRRLRPQDVAVLASLGIAEVPVISQPRVRIVVTGDELAQPGDEREEHQIYEANSFLLRGLVLRDGGVVTCRDAITGEEIYQQRVGNGQFFSSPVLVDGKIYGASRDGLVVVIKAGREFEKLAENKLDSGINASPAVANGRLFIRTDTHLMSLKGGK